MLNCSTAALADPIRPVSKTTDTSSIVKRLWEEGQVSVPCLGVRVFSPEAGRVGSPGFGKEKDDKYQVHDDKYNVDDVAATIRLAGRSSYYIFRAALCLYSLFPGDGV